MASQQPKRQKVEVAANEGHRRGSVPSENIDLSGFEDIDQAFVQLVNNVIS
jgi:hypothetical protein